MVNKRAESRILSMLLCQEAILKIVTISPVLLFLPQPSNTTLDPLHLSKNTG
jgi:hypothetical protein